MGYSGIYLIRRWHGETEVATVKRWTDALFDADERKFGTSPEDVARTIGLDEGFIIAVTRIVGTVNPLMKSTDSRSADESLLWVTLDDGGGPLVIRVSSDVQLQPRKFWRDGATPQSDMFHMLWSYATAIASEFDVVAHDPDIGDIPDLRLSEDEARSAYWGDL